MFIRKLKKDEIENAIRIKQYCWDNDYINIAPKGYLNIEDEVVCLTDWLWDESADDIRRVYGAIEDNELMGYIGASFAEDYDGGDEAVEINYLFMYPQYRGKYIGIKLFKTVADEYSEYGCKKVIVYNFHDTYSNLYYRHLGGEVVRTEIQEVAGKKQLIDVFVFNIGELKKTLNEKLYK